VTAEVGWAAFARRGVEPSTVVMRLVGILMSALILVPTAAILVEAFLAPGRPVPSLAAFASLVRDPQFGRGLVDTLISAAAASVCATALGVVLAWIVARTDVPGRRLFHVLNMVPFFLSPFVGAFAWSILAAPRIGIINRLLLQHLPLSSPPFNVFSLGGLVWVLTLFYTPYVYLLCHGPMRSLDQALEDAAFISGAGRVRTTLRITLPLLAPAILSGLLITFVASAEIFDLPILLTAPVNIPTLSTLIYQSVQYPADYHRAAAISAVLVAITMLGVLVQRRYLERRSFVTVTGKGYRPRRLRLGAWRWAAMAIEALYALVATGLPLLGLLVVACSSVWLGVINVKLLTLSNFTFVLTGYSLTQTALRNSLILAVSGATIGCLVALLIAHLIHRRRGRPAAALDLVTTMPLGLPGIVLALGSLIVWIRTPLYGTLWILLIAYVTRFLPYAQRNISGGLLAIGGELEQSGRVSGASWLTTTRKVLLPLLKPALASAWVMLFVIFVRELSTSILLYQSGTEVMSVAMLILSERNTAYTAAYAVLQTVLLLVVVGVFSLVFRIEEPEL
jgi:iron(III) transport system permease protein